MGLLIFLEFRSLSIEDAGAKVRILYGVIQDLGMLRSGQGERLCEQQEEKYCPITRKLEPCKE